MTVPIPDFLQTLTDARRADLLSQSRSLDVPRGSTLLSQGQPTSGLFVVETGLLTVQRQDRFGVECVLDLLSPGRSIGAAFVDAAHASPYSLVAARTSRVLEIAREPLLKSLGLEKIGLTLLLSEVRATVMADLLQFQDLKTRHATERLGWFVLRATEQDQSDAMRLEMDKSLLSAHLGMAPESLSRALKALTDHGVAFSSREIIVTERARLEGYLTRRQ